jgi:hypothetical protein
MKRLVLLGFGLAATGWGIVSALGGCSDDPAPAAPEGTSSGSNGDDDDGTSGNTTPPPPPPPTDAGAETGGQRATPGKMACGASTCDAGGENECCWVNFNPDAGQCAPQGCGFASAAELKCDDSADCPGGQKCCYGAGEANCAANCQQGQVQLCTTTQECRDAGACGDKNCDFGDFKFKVRMCGTHPTEPTCN